MIWGLHIASDTQKQKKEMSFEILRVIGLSQNIKHLYAKSVKSTLSTDFFANIFS